MTAGQLIPEPPEPGARDARPLASAVGMLGGAITRRAVFVSLLIMATSLPALIPRLDAEKSHPGTEVAVASSAVTTWARGTPDVLEQLQDRGVRTVILDMQPTREVVLAGQIGRIGPATVSRLRLTRTLPARGSGVWLRSRLNDPDGAWTAMVSMLRSRTRVVPGERVTAERLRQGKSWRGVLRWDTSAPWRDVPVGYDLRRIEQLTTAGFRVVPAIGPVQTRPAWLASVVRRAQQQASSNRYLLLDGAPLANPAADKQLARLLSAGGAHVLVGDALTDDQRLGVAVFEAASPGRVIRVHWADLGPSSLADGLVTSARRATKERGVRMVAARVQTPAPPLPESLTVLQEWQRDLPTSPIGAQPAPARVADPLPVVGQGYLPRGSGLLACFMVVALAIYLLTETRLYLRGHRWRVVARPLAALAYCALAMLALAAWLTKNQTLTGVLIYLAACAGAWAAITTAAAGLGRPPETGRYGTAGQWIGSLLRFGAAAVVVVAAGTAVAAAGAQPDYLLAVKGLGNRNLLLVLPVVAVALSAIAVLRVDRAAAVPERIVDTRLRWEVTAVVTVLAAALVAWTLMRFGRTDPAAELLGGDRLGGWLYVRPRFTELLIGFPALILALRWPGPIGRYVLLVMTAVAGAVTVGTFAHFDLPYWTAVLRTGSAMAGGLVLGVALSLLLPRCLPWLLSRLRIGRAPASGQEASSGQAGSSGHAGLPDRGTMES